MTPEQHDDWCDGSGSSAGSACCRLVAERRVTPIPTPAEQEREAGRLEALALHERYQRGELSPSEYERLRADLGKEADDLTRVDV